MILYYVNWMPMHITLQKITIQCKKWATILCIDPRLQKMKPRGNSHWADLNNDYKLETSPLTHMVKSSIKKQVDPKRQTKAFRSFFKILVLDNFDPT
jgi:hypothetical protein